MARSIWRRWASRGLCACTFYLAAAIAVGVTSSRARAAEQSGPAPSIQEHLAAGEFSAALELARRAGDRATRDSQLTDVAAAQSRAGMRSAAVTTLGEVSDDLTRAAALRELSSRNTTRAGARGGQEVDFDPLIDLITSTVAQPSWTPNGGVGNIMGFPGGVYVDPAGVLRPVPNEEASERLAAVRFAAREVSTNRSAARHSRLRKVSLPRLEKQVQLLLAAGRQPTEEMQLLAGLEKIEMVLVYPESGDVVLAGPAGDWQTGAEGRALSRETRRPVLRLEDLVIILRHVWSRPDARFGCSIQPSQENLARTKEFLDRSAAKPLKPGERDQWIARLREKMGTQQIDVFGIEPRTRVAQVLVEADYRMKLLGMGLEEGTLNVQSYLNMISVPQGKSPPPLGVLRWWFTMNYDALRATAERDAFELVGQGVKVLSENEQLTNLGQRVHTGETEPVNREFADSFTKEFPLLARKYPVYAELQNLFDMALVCALLKSEDLPERASWHLTCFGPGGQYEPTFGTAPESVESVVNYRVVNSSTILAGVSGGVHVDPSAYVKPSAWKKGTYTLVGNRSTAKPRVLKPDAWWWD